MKNPIEFITDFIFVENKKEKADIILVAGGSRPHLAKKAADLYHKGYAKKILISGGPNKKIPEWKTEWDFLSSILIKEGVPIENILKENKALHTFDNANYTFEVLQKNKISIKKVILVCKHHHSRRALMTYKTVFPLNIEFIVSSSIDERDITRTNWFLDQKKINIVLKEVEKIGLYFSTHIKNWK